MGFSRFATSAGFAGFVVFGVAVVSALAQAPDRSQPPPVGPAPALRLPAIQKATLANGVPLWVIEQHRVPLAQVNVILVDDEELLRMNREHLRHDYYTDVITFTIEEKPLEGEIYISLDRAREQAGEYRVGVYEEVTRLAIHGALHLAGYDDATEGERERMRGLEDRYLAS